jgi:hypothetical protein
MGREYGEPSPWSTVQADADILLANLHERSKTALMGKGPVQLSPGNQNVL